MENSNNQIFPVRTQEGVIGGTTVKTLYIAWNDPAGQRWLPVAMLYKEDDEYVFRYTQGSQLTDNFNPFPAMDDVAIEYRLKDLPPFFQNRLLSKNRPEFSDYMKWLNLSEESYNAVEVLALTEGKRATDSFEIFPCPQKDANGNYSLFFFSHGLRHLHETHVQYLNDIKTGERLYLMPDPQNPVDKNAVALRTGDPVFFVGYCPRFLADDFRVLLQKNDPDSLEITVAQVNPDAPLQFRIMCSISAPWPEDFEPCSGEHFQPIPESI